MSKTSLRKELATFTSEQLVEVILSAYDSSKEAKDYFEFFLNPDADALLDKKADIIARELNRSRRGTCKGRISLIRKAIKEFEAYGTGPEKTAQLMAGAIRMLVGQYRYLNYSEALLKGTFRLVHDYIVYADRNAMLQPALESLRAVIDDRNLGTAQMRDRIRRVMTDTIEEIAGTKGS